MCQGIAQHGRAGALGASGREFKSLYPDHFTCDPKSFGKLEGFPWRSIDNILYYGID